MSAQTSGDVSLINDEDLLRKMWQDTEDFGRKKEIRAHMYKLREARLRDFYNSGEVNTDIQRTTTKTTTESKSCSTPTHADSLADHSFISMKTKEIRDSESPTRDVSYRVTDKGLANQGWNIVTSNKKSDDGKTFTTSKVATTSGSENIVGGKLDYAAKNEQQASVYKDGDDKNFTKAVGASSNTHIKQEASGGDENSSFRSSSTKTSSSSKYVTEQRSTSGDVVDSQIPSSRMITQNQNDEFLVSRKTYTDNIPNELKNHPSYVDGKTKVTRETRTLPDGTTVTTTKYEIKSGSNAQSSRSNQYNTTQQRSTTVNTSQAVDSRTNKNELRTTKFIEELQPENTTTTVTRHIHDSRDQELQPAITRTVTKTARDQQLDSVDDLNSKTTVVYGSRNDDLKSTSKTTVVKNVYDSKEEARNVTKDSNITTRTTSNLGRTTRDQLDSVDDRSTKTTVVYDSRNEPRDDLRTTTKTTVIKNINDSREEPSTINDSNVTTRTSVIKNIYDSRDQSHPIDDSHVTTRTTLVKNIYDLRDQPRAVDDSNVTTRTTVVKKIYDSKDQSGAIDDTNVTTRTTLVKNIYDSGDQPRPIDDTKTTTTSTRVTVTKQINDSKDGKRQTEDYSTTKVNRHKDNEKFIIVEQQDTRNRMEPNTQTPERIEPKIASPEKRPTAQEKYEIPERRQPIKPGKSELGDAPKSTEGQYETTYRTDFTNKRTDFTNKRISVDVSPTHEAFARSLRAVSPDRISKCSSPSRGSLRTSTNSLRSSSSPEKNRHPSRLSPERRSVSPRKATSTETITRKTKTSADTVTRKSNIREIDSSTLTRRKNRTRTRSRSPSPTSIASDIEYIRNTDLVTDLDTNETTVITNSRPSSLEIIRRSPKKITDRSPTSPLTDRSSPNKSPGTKDVLRRSSLRNVSPNKEVHSPKSDKPFKRTDTYEERCRQILGIANETEKRRTSLERITANRIGPAPKATPEKKSPNKDVTITTRKSPEKKIQEFPSQFKRSPDKGSLERHPQNKSSVKDASKITEFPSQIRKSPEKEPLAQYPTRKSPTKETPKINEFPAQIRKSPEKEPLTQYSQRKSPCKDISTIGEFPSQIKRSPEKQPLGEYPDTKSPTKMGPKISEFPSQIPKSPEKEPLGEYPDRKGHIKEAPKISEFPSQIRKSPKKEPLIEYPDRQSPIKEAPKISEFPSQIRKSPAKEPLGEYSDRRSPIKEASKISEFPSQIKKSSEKPLEKYAEEPNKINEFPGQIRRSPEKEPLEENVEKVYPATDVPTICESSSQIRRFPDKNLVHKESPQNRFSEREYPDQVAEIPHQIRKSPEKGQLQDYPVVTKPEISEFPSQNRKFFEKEPIGRYPDRSSPTKYPSQVNEFSSPNKKEPFEQHADQTKPQKGNDGPKISEFPSQIRKSPEKTLLQKYPEKTPPTKDAPKISEFPSQIKKTSEKEPLGKYPEKIKPKKEAPKIDEFPSQIRKSPEKELFERYPEKTRPSRDETRQSPEKEYVSKIYPTSSTKKDKPRERTNSSSSSTTDEEKDIEEVNTVTRISELETRVPVNEPVVTKKFISQLCKDDEIQRSDITRKNTQNLINKEILETGLKTPNRTVKKDSPNKPQDIFIDNERTDTNITIHKYSSPKTGSPVKKPITEKTNVMATNKKITSTTKIDTKSVRKIADDKSKPKDIKKTTEKISLYDVENSNETKEDSRIHIRTHRVDDAVNKKVIKTIVNGDIIKKGPTKRSQPTKLEEPKTKKPIEKKPQKVVTKSLTETETRRIITEQKTPKRHVVTTTITVSPKSRPSPAKTPTRLVTPKSTTVAKVTPKVTKKRNLQNGHVSSDDESIADSLEGDITEEILTTLKQKGKIIRTISDQVIKKKTDNKIPVRGLSKPELLSSKTKLEKKCITTKSIVINNEATEREIIVDLQRSKSSREPTPDRICPLPTSSDDETTPRYPDQIAEPDDDNLRRKPKKLSDIPILEGEDIRDFNRITEIEDTKVDRVEATDESLLSVNTKINRFFDTTDKFTKHPQGPAAKVERPRLDVDEDLKTDECLLSVSQKVNKFITTAEQLSLPQEVSQRPKSPKCQYYPEDEVSVSDKVAHFITTAEKIVTSQKAPAPKIERPNFHNLDEAIKEDECLLSVSDKVSKFINTAEKLTSDTKKTNVSLSKIDVKPSKKSYEPEETYTRIASKETTPTRKPSNQYSSIKAETQERKHIRRDSSPKLADSTPKSTRRPYEEEPKSVLSPNSRLKSTESVKQAKALFENINKDQQVFKQRDILSRPSVFEGRKINKTEIARKLDYESEEDEKVLKSTRLVMSKVHARPKSPEKILEVFTRRSQSPDGDVPGYMKPLDRSLRPNSPHRDSVNQINQINKKYTTIKDEENQDVRHTKFGVTLKRTDSGRVITTTTTQSAKNRMTLEGVTEAEIEEIYDLEILEDLLEKVVDYDLRRKIRGQIRIVKKLISESNLVEVTSKKSIIREKSPVETINQSKEAIQTSTEYQSSYSYNERRSSSEYTKVTRRSQSPETKSTRSKTPTRNKTSEYPKVTGRNQSPETKPTRSKPSEYPKVTRRSQSPEIKQTRSKTPEKSTSKTTKLFQTPLKKTSPSARPIIEDNAPEWVKQRNLKKLSDSTVTTKSSSTTTTTTKKSRSSPLKETKTTDIITSGYGVGPTDENGSPLFGLKALRARNKTDTTKVQGTVIRSQYYSENGQEPVGEISVTKYSSDPRDLGRDEDVKRKGVTTITTTQKFGYKDTPSLKNLTNSKKNKEICDTIEDELTTKTSKVNRRGSVKALSQKFIENAVETSKSERQSSYPKAGLILRTSSFKDSASSGDSREGSSERTVTVKTSSSRTVAGETFLTNRNKVTGVQDVISRMKTEDIREGDSTDDVEARGLLNKFIGAQVILSGIESNVKSSSTTTNAKRSTKITTTVTEGGKPTIKTRIFQHPITEKELGSVWDEQSLKLLLEQSTDYEERRSIRARLRQVMAEQEACTELVEKASQDQIGTTFEGESQLLPLLQGLLEAPDNEQTADSGTESGEDQRNGLIAEVQNALDKLSANLRDDTTDITPERRSSLLQLVSKLQAGLASSVPTHERRSSVQGRFRRRQRPNRHTVGVSSEELADARRLIEEISLHELTPSQSKISLLQKQNSEGCVGQTSTSSFKPFLPQKTAVKNAVAKPFSSSNSTVSGNSSSVQTPTDTSLSLDLLFNEESVEKKPDFSYRSVSMDDQKIRRSSSGEVSIKSIQQAVQQAAAIKVLTKSPENLLESEETDEDTTVKTQTIKHETKEPEVEKPIQDLPQPDLVMQNNPIYFQQKKTSGEEKSNKFNTKKLKMKRANTIDIPKPLKFYEADDDSDCSLPEEDYNQRRRSNYLALRGPIRVGNPGNNKNVVPILEAKTDNDKKFLAFINKHTENSDSSGKNSLWSKPESNKANVWSSKFGNIKTAFEKVSTDASQSKNSARQFWKTADDAITIGPKYDGPKISKQSARNLRQMFEEKQKQTQKLPWSATPNDKNVVTGSLTVKAFESNEKKYKFVPQPLPVNKFSHAPQSAFKPLPKKIPPSIHIPKTVVKPEIKEKDLDSPLFLYSPKPTNEPSLKPWVTSPSESRVLSLAASKFENIPQQEVIPLKPRKLSKDKMFLPFQQQTPEKLTAPYLVKSVEHKNNNIVRQLSGQYDNLGEKNNDSYSTYSTVKYTSPQSEKVPNYQEKYNKPQQFTQQYNQQTPQYNVRNATQQYYLPNQQYGYQNQHYHVPHTQQYGYQNQHYPQVTGGNPQYLPPGKPQDVSRSQPQAKSNQSCPLQNHQGPQDPKYLPQHQNNQEYGSLHQQCSAVNESTNSEHSNQPERDQNYYHSNQPQQNNEPQYTSTYQYTPATQTLSPSYGQKSQQPEQQRHEVAPKNVKEVIQSEPPKFESQVSVESLKEYNAVSSRVMTGPVCQQATTIRQKSPMNRDEHDLEAALNLRTSLQKVGSPQKMLASNMTNSSSNKEIPQKVVSPINPNYKNREELEHVMSPSSYDYRNKEDSHSVAPSNNSGYREEPKQMVSSPQSKPQQFVSSSNYNYTVREEPPKIISPPSYNYKIKEEPPKIVSPTNYDYNIREEPPRIASSTTYNYKIREEPPKIVSPNSFSYRPNKGPQKPISPHSFSYNSRKGVQNMISTSGYNKYRTANRSVESLEINDNGESVVTSKFQIPVINVPQPQSPRPPNQIQIMNKADSWNQICIQKQQPQHKPSPRASPNARTVSKSKSSLSLALPKQFEAGMSKDEMAQKRKTMEAFLGGGSKSPQPLSRTSSNNNLSIKPDSKVVKRSINRLKTSEKVSTCRQSTGLSRSRTLPDIVCANLLDESNMDKAFEDLFKSSS